MNVDQDGFRQKVLSLIQNDVQWIPESSRNRIASMVESRPDWCLSRQRNWGVPLPIVYCQDCGEPVIAKEIFDRVEALFAAETADAWFAKDLKEILPAGLTCRCGGQQFRRETDILDVWFDSGVSHAAVLRQRPQLTFPADMYLEGSDQHRGWFQVSLLTAAATAGQAPYRTVLTHGYTVDGEGRKMSKSLGNFISATVAIQRYGGADILRLWVCSENIQNDVRCSDEIFKRMVDSYRRIRNTLRYLLGNLKGFEPGQAMPADRMRALDRLMLHRLQAFMTAATESYDACEMHRVFQLLQNFCAADLSAFYFDILKDRLYADAADSESRRSAQTALWHLLQHLVRVIAPVLVHTAEEAWSAMTAQGLVPEDQRAPSVHMSGWLTIPSEWRDDSLASDWAHIEDVRSEALKQLEEARNRKLIRHSYEAQLRLAARGERLAVLRKYQDQLAPWFVVSGVAVAEAGPEAPELAAAVEPAAGSKCERCWLVLPSVGSHADHPGLCDRCHAVIREAESKETVSR